MFTAGIVESTIFSQSDAVVGFNTRAVTADRIRPSGDASEEIPSLRALRHPSSADAVEGDRLLLRF